MAEFSVNHSDMRPSALYLLAHEGPLRSPFPIEIQHMRIRRYMGLLHELRGQHHHFSEADDIYVDFNFEGTWQFPSLMRLGEAVGRHQYKAIFTDLPGGAGPGSSNRDSALPRLMYSLKAFPVELINVRLDPYGVLAERAKRTSEHWERHIVDELSNPGHDILCFFPGLAADVLRAAFFPDWEERDSAVSQRIGIISDEHPYRAGAVPDFSERLVSHYYDIEEKNRQEQAKERRAAGETLYCIDPTRQPVLIEERTWGNEPVRSSESLAAAEARVISFGFHKQIDGAIVSLLLEKKPFTLFADIRVEGKITVEVFRLEEPKGNRKKPRWTAVYGGGMTILDTWWKSDASRRFDEFAAKKFQELTASISIAGRSRQPSRRNS
jgi:hypothetical protein